MTIVSQQGDRSSRYVIAIVAYYLVLLPVALWGVLDIWSGQLTLLRLAGVPEALRAEPLARSIGFTLVGGFLGSILYHIRTLFHHYTRGNFDRRWLGKYLTGPWEGAALAAVVLSLAWGGITVLANMPLGEGRPAANNFGIFATGALVGFGMRDVVGWLGTLVQSMFNIERPSAPNEQPKNADV